MSNKENETLIQGTVEEALPNVMFRIILDDGRKIIAYLSGKMRMHRIKVIIGDKVEMVEDLQGNRHRIVRRL
ncbi:translation initiation factor IF-1 [Candidatus Nomurabacteria bacterium RIFCSPHIGHO2_02_FULL_33_12]|uniref:Translation initiation factor IF-1 n=1 Tax=Candidatus Nomurabacteria bacterium RIFCSPLOWO2_01_FULL_33_17 TaxID=1801764 RepID=A0A1F6WQK1_9BACT|nr:MAG: translation initiation factor IF-1 [Candidatus Nomurabacteria bacterium RIFCSPHIGHO2_02_FULL_33_12]OGI84192.1 MAG: translation initiation factor IF-1 [Candidatus Nomurabacteria bacterium RIFCSPLOWO2_01_FULL_33_17]